MVWFRRRVRAVADPVWVDLTEPDTLGRFREAAALWSCGVFGGSDDTVMLACDLLVEGFDTPSLRELAGLPAREAWRDSRDVLQSTFEELGIAFVEEDSTEVALIALRSLCRRFLTGALPEREFAQAAYSLFAYDAPAVAHDLAYLEYDFECFDDGHGHNSDPSGLADTYARAFLSAVSTGSTTGQ